MSPEHIKSQVKDVDTFITRYILPSPCIQTTLMTMG